MKEKPHERLDRLMNDRRLQLPKTDGKTVKWFQVAERAGITVTTLTALRKGQNEPTEDTKRGVESALRWQPGSIDAILAGGDPTIREQRVPVGRAVEHDSAPAVRVYDARLEVPSPSDEEDDPKVRRAMELMAEAQALLAEIRRERREGA